MIEPFKYEWTSTLEWLIEQAKGKPYSTFSFYKKELDEAMQTFQENISKN